MQIFTVIMNESHLQKTFHGTCWWCGERNMQNFHTYPSPHSHPQIAAPTIHSHSYSTNKSIIHMFQSNKF